LYQELLIANYELEILNLPEPRAGLPAARASSRLLGSRGSGLWADDRQPFPNWVMEELPTIWGQRPRSPFLDNFRIADDAPS